VITVRLMDGTRVSGLLEGFDRYTVAVSVAGRAEPVLVNKHAVAVFMRREAKADDAQGRAEGTG
jgi:RNA chaperone Hfq